ncbi:protein of unknown function [Thermanaeromonas toyohensis ToBE]|uniref:Phage minor structural protein GP20 n=1 Tax=Thermanaeromonas toyohensis ToBE TaxID=698762 RepID=A0A1W1VX08_9FIRM|nr:DUF4355 domain-containing protein [Thermanaeromonas toyohensis]SMB97790.1 protein of unknown function [Thermanaeromonas toyohensis ToBE]
MADDNKNLNPTNPNPEPNPGDGGQGNDQGNPPAKTFTQEELERILAERLKREREKYKDYEDLKKAAEELKKLKEAQMSETEKLQAKLAELERERLELELQLQEARLESLKLKVLDEMGLPKAWASRIFGTTEEEIRQDAEELKKMLGAAGKTVGSGTNPPGGGNVPKDIDTQIAEAEAKGDWATAIYLKGKKFGQTI